MGFRVVPVPSTEVLTSLQSGMLDAFALTPLTAAAVQWFALAPNMSEFNWAPMLGGIVISENTWRRIPEDLRPKLLEAAARLEQALRRDTEKLENEAMGVMKSYGLKIHPTPPAVRREWETLTAEGFEFLIGTRIDRGVYEQIERHLEAYRNR